MIQMLASGGYTFSSWNPSSERKEVILTSEWNRNCLGPISTSFCLRITIGLNFGAPLENHARLTLINEFRMDIQYGKISVKTTNFQIAKYC